MKTCKETDIQLECIKYLASIGWVVIRVNSAQFGKFGVYKCSKWRSNVIGDKEIYTGTPDIIACDPEGRFYGIEFKRPGKDPSPAQLLFKKALKSTKGHYLVIRSLNGLKRMLGKIKSA